MFSIDSIYYWWIIGTYKNCMTSSIIMSATILTIFSSAAFAGLLRPLHCCLQRMHHDAMHQPVCRPTSSIGCSDAYIGDTDWCTLYVTTYCVSQKMHQIWQAVVLTRQTQTSFYPRDVVSAVYATATWLSGWVSVRHTPLSWYIFVSKRLNLS